MAMCVTLQVTTTHLLLYHMFCSAKPFSKVIAESDIRNLVSRHINALKWLRCKPIEVVQTKDCRVLITSPISC